MKTLDELQADVKQEALDKLRDGVGEGHACDLHHEIFNMDYFIVGTWDAKQWLGDATFAAIEAIREYEQDNFGEVNTDFSDPEKVANILAYILGEQVLQESETLQEKWDGILDAEDLTTIADELEG